MNEKGMKLTAILMVLLAACLFTACDGGGGGGEADAVETFTIEYNGNGAEKRIS